MLKHKDEEMKMSYSSKRLKTVMRNEKQRPFLSTERKTLCHVLNGFKVERWEQKFGVAIDGCTRLDRFMCPQKLHGLLVSLSKSAV